MDGRGVDVRVKRGSLSESRETRVPPPAMGRSLPCPSLIIADVKGSRQPSTAFTHLLFKL